MTGWSAAERAEYERQKRLDTSIAEMNLSVRSVNILESAGIIRCRDVMTQTYESLTSTRNFGDKALNELKSAIRALGLEPPEWRGPGKPPPRPKILPENLLDSW